MDRVIYDLAERLGLGLQERELKLVTAESCTGGWVSQAVTAVPGSSEWFDRGFVTYSNVAKQEMLGVSAETLEQHGAVSINTVEEMVAGALSRSCAQVALAISGVAGPSGGTLIKPVGMVCFSCGHQNGRSFSETWQLVGDREAVRFQAVVRALSGALRLLDE